MLRGNVLAAVWCVCFGALGAADDIERLIAGAQQNPKSAVLCERVGVAYINREDLPHAREWFEKALTLDPARTSARKNLATVLWFEGQRVRAERLFADLAKRVPADPVPHLYLGLAAYGRAQFEAAAKQFAKAGDLASANPEVRPTVADTYLKLAETYDGMNRPAQAYDAFRNAVALDGGEDSAVALARFSIKHGNIAYAREVLATEMKAHADSAKLSFEDGVAAALQGNFDQAMERFGEAERKSPTWSAPVLAHGLTLLQQGKPDDAADTFRRATKMAAGDSRAHLLLAMALLRAGAKTDVEKRNEATAAAKRAIQLDPKSGRAHAVLAEIEQADNQQQAALRDLETANRLDPGNATTLYQLSQAYRREGRDAEARQALLAFEAAKAKTNAEENELVEILVKAP